MKLIRFDWLDMKSSYYTFFILIVVSTIPVSIAIHGRLLYAVYISFSRHIESYGDIVSVQVDFAVVEDTVHVQVDVRYVRHSVSVAHVYVINWYRHYAISKDYSICLINI